MPKAANDSAVPVSAVMIVGMRLLFVVCRVHKMMLPIQGGFS
jgi:hypothetical protein